MIGGTGMSLVCGINRSRRRMVDIRRSAVPEDGCSNWKRQKLDDIMSMF